MVIMVTTCVFVQLIGKPIPTHLILVKKERPEWMKGMYNMPGGHVEDSETPEEAARREMFEETGLVAGEMIDVGDIRPNEDAGVYLFATLVKGMELGEISVKLNLAAKDHGESLHVMTIGDAMNSRFLMPDMYFVIPESLKRIVRWRKGMPTK